MKNPVDELIITMSRKHETLLQKTLDAHGFGDNQREEYCSFASGYLAAIKDIESHRPALEARGVLRFKSFPAWGRKFWMPAHDPARIPQKTCWFVKKEHAEEFAESLNLTAEFVDEEES